MVDLERAARLRQARLAAGFARPADAIAAFGWTSSTYFAHENGFRGISRDRVLVYATSFRVRPDWLAFGLSTTDTLSRNRVQIGGYMGESAKIIEQIEQDAPQILDEVDTPATIVTADWTAYRVNGNSNFPAFHDGDVIFVRRVQRSPSDYLNRECLVTMTDGQKFIRTILRGSRIGVFVLIGFNNPPLIDVEVSAASPVEWIRRG